MKKNFVKKTLASTLALAMVATSMPAAFATADAAKAPALNKKAKTLYINENEIGSSFNFNVKNTVKGSTYKWTTSNKAVATVNAKNGVTKAGTKTGKATISCKITFKTKKTKTLKATVTVKENATKVTIKNAPEKEIGIGENAYDFNSTMTSASGAKATDYRTWEIDAASNTAGATINAKSGKVTTTKAGIFKVRVRAYQNKAKLAANDTVDSDWLEVKVVSSLVSVTQNSVTKLTATFDDNMKEKVKSEDFAIKNKATNVVSAVKSVSFSEDGKAVTVETFAQFADGATYVVTYGGKEFEVATTIGDVATVEVSTTTAVVNEETEIKYVLKNANGVDITDAKGSDVSFEAVENDNGYLNGNKLTIFEKGKTAKIKVTYHTYKYGTNGTEEGAVSTEVVITGVDKTAATVGNYKNYVITSSASVNWNKVTENKNVICIGEEGMKLFVRALDSTGKDVDTTGFTYESGNENLLLVNGNTLVAVKEGATVVVVKNADGKVLWTLDVVIKAERAANTIALAKTSTTLVMGSGITTDSIEVQVKDQHGDSMDSTGKIGSIVEIGSAPAGVVVADPTNAKNVSVNIASVTTAGTYQYKVYLKDSTTKLAVLTVVVKDKITDPKITMYRLDLSATTADTVVDADTTGAKSITGKVVGYASGLPYENSEVKVVVTNSKGETVSSSTNGSFKLDYVSVSGSQLVKLAKGVYTVTAYGTDGKTVVDKKLINITDTQVAPKVTVNTNKGTGDVVTVLNASCKVVSAYGEELKNSITAYDGTVNGKQVYVKTVTIKEVLNTTGTYVLHTVAVGQTFTIQ